MLIWFLCGLLGSLLVALEHYLYMKKVSYGRVKFDTDDLALLFIMVFLGPIGIAVSIGCFIGFTKLKSMVKPYKDSQWL